MHQPWVILLTASVCFAVYKILRKRWGVNSLPAALGTVTSWQLFLVSMAGLYIELVLIRWIGTEVRIFAFVQNLALIACFLGFGVGCFTTSRGGGLIDGLERIALVAILVTLPLTSWQNMLGHLSNVLGLSADSALWGVEVETYLWYQFLLAVVMTGLLLWLIAAAMIPVGRWVGYCFDHSKNTVRAYTVNLFGSLLGTWLLLAMAILSLPPIYWFASAFLLVILVLPKTRGNIAACILLAAPVLLFLQTTQHDRHIIWSPYQKFEITPLNPSEYLVTVNSSVFMTMADTTPTFLATHPATKNGLKDSAFDSPFRFVNKNPRVLVVGAGAGNDVSGALRHGASHVDAVEIDPVIYRQSKKLHPDRPYDDPRVNLIINDARNYLRLTKNTYDAIIFASLDSHTGPSGYSNMRVDNYVYTREAFEQAKKLLRPDGILVFKFEVRHPWTWIGQRFYRSLSEVFGREPLLYLSSPTSLGNLFSGYVFLESNDDRLWQIAQQPEVKKFLAQRPPAFTPDLTNAPSPATDDWPYPYNRDRMVPSTYGIVSLILLVLAFFLVRRDIRFRERESWSMFGLGVGFMLMETQLINRLCLYFGTTWIVSSIAISTILVVLVFANLLVRQRFTTDRRPLFIMLIASLIGNYFIPWETLGLSPIATCMLLSAAFAVSVFIAGLIFTSTLRAADHKSAALGANVLGTVLGGIAQNLSFIFGLKALLLFAAGAYAMAGYWQTRSPR